MQTRLHALAVADTLFARSRAFRGHLAAQFPMFLELAIGFRPARPLPGPPRLSTKLREAALDAVERWHDAHGASHQQVSFLSLGSCQGRTARRMLWAGVLGSDDELSK